MTSITISDLRRHWPDVENILQAEKEILITRYSKPVAKLVYIEPAIKNRKRWDPVAHGKWMKKVWGNKLLHSSDALLAELRADRKLM